MRQSPNPRSTFSAICVSNGVVLGRARATVGLPQDSRYSRALARFQSAFGYPFERRIAAVSSNGWRKLAGKLERTRTPIARFPAIFVLGPRTICNFLGAFKALRSLSSNALVQFLQEPTSRVFHSLFLAPAFLSVPVLHVSNRHQKDGRDHGKSTRKYG